LFFTRLNGWRLCGQVGETGQKEKNKGKEDESSMTHGSNPMRIMHD